MNKTFLNSIAFILTCIYTFKIAQSGDVDNARIYGGTYIKITDAPYQVSVRLKNLENYKFGAGHICGGSVITSRVVLTAAHCTASSLEHPIEYRHPTEFILVMGDTYLQDKTSKTLQFDVQQIVVHPNFNKPTYIQNDLALMFFRGSVPANQNNVRPIAINTVALADNIICKVSGWGKVNAMQIPNNLMQAEVPIVNHKTCQTNYGQLPESTICAGFMTTGGVDACQGDSGGPFVCNSQLAGIVSWGYGCARPGYPGVYTNVSYFDGWIEKTNATFNYSSYTGGTAFIERSLILLVLGITITILQ